MHANRLNERRTTIAVVTRMRDVLQVERIVDTAPRMQVVIALKDVLAAVVQVAVAEEKAQAAQPQVRLMIFFDGVGDEGNAKFVVGA